MGLRANLSFLARLAFARLTRRRVPLIAQFSVTNRCTARCTYCYARYYAREHPELPTADALRVIDELARAGARRISLVGGEPLVRADIGDLVRRVKERGAECALTTNGDLVERKLDACRQLDLLSVSLDGAREGHDANRGQGSFDRALHAIRVARAEGIPVQTSTVVTRATLDDLDFLVATARELGFCLSFIPLINQTQPDGKQPIADLMATAEEYRRYFADVVARKRAGAPILFAAKLYEYVRQWPDFSTDKFLGDARPAFRHFPCNAGRYSVLVDANGDVYPCPQLVDVLPVKNLFEVGFQEAWRHIQDHRCHTCFSPCSNNMNLLLSLDLGVMWDLFRSYAGRGFGRPRLRRK
ncbi:MAG TPA: radical SAM protein [Planctomycetota bacterium]|nr:radical SAM protein [Planctomycetota bacterium]